MVMAAGMPVLRLEPIRADPMVVIRADRRAGMAAVFRIVISRTHRAADILRAGMLEPMEAR